MFKTMDLYAMPFSVLRLGSESSWLYFLLFLFRTRSSSISFTRGTSQLTCWSYEIYTNCCSREWSPKCQPMLLHGQQNILVEENASFGNIGPINKVAFSGSESILLSAAAIKAMLEAG